jgi:hypothetical protein
MTQFVDTFTGTNGTQINSYDPAWGAGNYASFEIQSNQLKPKSSITPNISYTVGYSGRPWTAAQQCTITAGTLAAGQYIGAGVRVQADGKGLFFVMGSGDDFWYIVQTDGVGGDTVIQQAFLGADIAAGQTLTVEISITKLLTVKRQGSTLTTHQYIGALTGGSPGVYVWGDTPASMGITSCLLTCDNNTIMRFSNPLRFSEKMRYLSTVAWRRTHSQRRRLM